MTNWLFINMQCDNMGILQMIVEDNIKEDVVIPHGQFSLRNPSTQYKIYKAIG